MANDAAAESKIVSAYRARTRRAAELHRKARGVLPSGIVHDSRRTLPYGIYGDRAARARASGTSTATSTSTTTAATARCSSAISTRRC